MPRSACLLAGLLLLVLTSGVVWLARQALPQLEGTRVEHGLASAADVHRGQAGALPLYADSGGDLFLSLERVHARDSIWQMHRQRHVIAGSLSGPMSYYLNAQLKAIKGRREGPEGLGRPSAALPQAIFTEGATRDGHFGHLGVPQRARVARAGPSFGSARGVSTLSRAAATIGAVPRLFAAAGGPTRSNVVAFGGLPGVTIGRDHLIMWKLESLAPAGVALYLVRTTAAGHEFRDGQRPLVTSTERIEVAEPPAGAEEEGLDAVDASGGGPGSAPIKWLFDRGSLPAEGYGLVVARSPGTLEWGYQESQVPSTGMIVELAELDNPPRAPS